MGRTEIMAADIANRIGQSLSADRCRVTAKLGEGGMGFVSRAHDSKRASSPCRGLGEHGSITEGAIGGRSKK
jgi:hypothetical protein